MLRSAISWAFYVTWIAGITEPSPEPSTSNNPRPGRRIGVPVQPLRTRPRSERSSGGATSRVPAATIPATIPATSGPGTVLAFPAGSRQPDDFDARVDAALTAMAARRSRAADDLYDLVSRPLYALALAVTKDKPAAEEATVAAFVELWMTSGSRPPGSGTAWVMEVACRCAHSTATGPRVPARRGRLHLVTSG